MTGPRGAGFALSDSPKPSYAQVTGHAATLESVIAEQAALIAEQGATFARADHEPELGGDPTHERAEADTFDETLDDDPHMDQAVSGVPEGRFSGSCHVSRYCHAIARRRRAGSPGRPGSLHVPAKLTTGGRRRKLRIPSNWPWAKAIESAFAKITAIPAHG